MREQAEISQIVINITTEGMSVMKDGEIFIDTVGNGPQSGIGLIMIAGNINLDEEKPPILGFKCGDRRILGILSSRLKDML